MRVPTDGDAVDRYASMHDAGVGMLVGASVAVALGTGLLAWGLASSGTVASGDGPEPAAAPAGTAKPPDEPPETPNDEPEPPPEKEEDGWSHLLLPVPGAGGAAVVWRLRF